jgi:hypothetical protein
MLIYFAMRSDSENWLNKPLPIKHADAGGDVL